MNRSWILVVIYCVGAIVLGYQGYVHGGFPDTFGSGFCIGAAVAMTLIIAHEGHEKAQLELNRLGVHYVDGVRYRLEKDEH